MYIVICVDLYLLYKICYKMALDNENVKAFNRKDIIDHGIKFVMDYNEDRWGPVSRNSGNGGTFDEDVLDNGIGDVQRKESASVYFQNIGTAHCTR